MPCRVSDALHLDTNPLNALLPFIQQTYHALTGATRILFSFNSLLIVSLISFLFLGSAVTVFIICPFFTDPDEYDECERAMDHYMTRTRTSDWPWVSVPAAVPIILVDRSCGGKDRDALSPHQEKQKHHRPHH
ncbi:hypothetical protein R3P38DRAFT_2845884 [Favolaschia claudopus]|uniref:Uncharacterized protein n=1 Tax=Favolaschia claudopus TaxID=2862362 RepID=A0AAW0DR51_9AGAR